MFSEKTEESGRKLFRKRRKKSFFLRAFFSGSLIAAFSSALLLSSCKEKETVLEFAMFSGSNWEVAIQDSYQVIDFAIEKFEKSHPGVRVEYVSGILKDDYSEWLSRRILKDEMPDVLIIPDEDFQKFVELGLLENLDKTISKDPEFDKSAYYDTALASGAIEGGRYALPMETVPYLMCVNKTLLEKEGIDMPDEDYTFADLYDICRRVTKDTDGDGVYDQFGIHEYSWLDAAVSNGAILFSEDGRNRDFMSSELETAIKFVKSLNDLNDGRRVTQEDFDSGNVAFMPLTLAEYRTYKSYPYKIKKYSNFRWDCISMPRGPAGDNVSIVDSLNVGISSGSKNKKLAWEFLKFLTGDEEIQMKVLEYTPAASVLSSVTESREAEEIMKDNTDASDRIIDSRFIGRIIDKGRAIPKLSFFNEVISAADSEIEKVYEEDTDIKNAMRLITRRIKSIIEE